MPKHLSADILDDHPLSESTFNQIYSTVPRLNVEVVIRGESGFVLTRRTIPPHVGLWHVPGGTVHFGESLHEAVRRVAHRELGVQVRVQELLGYIEYPLMHAAGYFGWPVGIAFGVELVDGVVESMVDSDEVGHFKTIPSDTIEDQAIFLRSLVE